ncbi:MAG: MOSC N-terminal beta barrel domain-containing protein [Vicinamibacteria bacterium]
MTTRNVGRVVSLWRYPVKSMAAQSLDTVDVSWHGLVGDRRWAFIRDGVVRSGFPWLTIREKPEMRNFVPFFADPTQPNKSVTMVRTPTGEELDVVDQALAAHLGGGVRVIKQDMGVFDTFPLSLISTQTIATLGGLTSLDLHPQRFRPNLLIDAPGEAFPEDAWVGAVLKIGSMRMRVDKPDGRCVMVNLDPISSESNPSVLKTIARERESRLGVYGSTVEPGVVSVGDAVFLESKA